MADKNIEKSVQLENSSYLSVEDSTRLCTGLTLNVYPFIGKPLLNDRVRASTPSQRARTFNGNCDDRWCSVSSDDSGQGAAMPAAAIITFNAAFAAFVCKILSLAECGVPRKTFCVSNGTCFIIIQQLSGLFA